MSNDAQIDSELEIAHVLFTDIVGYSKLPVDAQSDLVRELNQVVRNTAQFRKAEAAGKLIRIPTGDGVALAFFTTPDAPVRCAMEIGEALVTNRKLQLRMGIHSGPVDAVSDVNDRSNVAGAGINMAQRVMDCGDAGHILLSKRIADDLAQYSKWQPHLHDLGEAEVKHGVRLGVVNFYGENFGNKNAPEKLERAQRKEEDVARTVASRTKRRRKWQFVGATGVALILLGLGFWISQRVPHSLTGSVIPEKSIAVLPFDNFGDEKENAYFADGVQDDILTDLAKVADLKVISRRSVAQFRGSTKGAREIGQALGVGHLLEGSVRKAAGRIRITVQLIDARTDQHLWAETYDRELADVFAIQSELAQKIALALKAVLSPTEKAAIEEQPTQNLEAYDIYLRAKELIYQINSRGDWGANLTAAIDLVNQAVARDPKFALAFSFLAELHVRFYWTAGRDPTHLEGARVAVEKALQLAPHLGEAHLAQGLYFYQGLRDNERALAEFAVARRALPNNAEVLAWTGLIERRLNRWKEAVSDQSKAAELDPHDSVIRRDLLSTYYLLRDYPEAERVLDRTLIAIPQDADYFRMQKAKVALMKGDTKGCRAILKSLPPDYNSGGFVSYLWGQLALYARDYAEAGRVLEEARKSLGDNAAWWIVRDQAFLARAQGDATKAQSAFQVARKSWEESLNQDPDNPDVLAMVALFDAGLGRKQEALRESQKAAELRPISRDPVDGPETAKFQALVNAWCGERDLALQQLTMLVKIPGDLAPGDLKLSPTWDDLRGDVRFEEIAAEAAKPCESRLTAALRVAPIYSLVTDQVDCHTL